MIEFVGVSDLGPIGVVAVGAGKITVVFRIEGDRTFGVGRQRTEPKRRPDRPEDSDIS